MPKILEILQSEYYTEYEMIEKEYLIPKIYHGGKNFDISKRWYVYYSYLNPATGMMTRQSAIYMKVNRIFTRKQNG
jgi:hypothetical protein